ncbi:MAG: hypothetical protein HOC71_00715 [Candidatus Latescibacteria bacterium]|jgi:hypothetical protein|nr:hypothetical protein [Candidatus Latescibacterota bacterium]
MIELGYQRKLFSVVSLIIILAFLLPFLLSSGHPCMAVNSLSAGKCTEDNDLLQFTAGNHILGFQKNEMYIASIDHALKIAFVGAHDVTPEETVSTAFASVNSRDTKPLGVVTYPNLWKGVTLVYERTVGGAVKSTYYVAPASESSKAKTHAPVEHIRLHYNAPVSLDESGNLLLVFETGQMRESAPVAWQEIAGKRVPVAVNFRIMGEYELGFSVGSYDPLFPLVIDPVLTWNTFIGSENDDTTGNAIAVDGSGNIYIAGVSDVTWGTPVNAFAGGNEAFAAKFNTSGVLQWNTFMGSGTEDYGNAIAVDGSGNIYVTGTSDATWGSTVVNAHTGFVDAFAAKLDTSGVLQWNTFMGHPQNGGGSDYGNGIAVDGSGNIYIVGTSDGSWGTPVVGYTAGDEAFVAKFNTVCRQNILDTLS